MNFKNLVVFASGGPVAHEGGSGFEKLVLAADSGLLRARIVAVVSNHPEGGVYTKAKKHGINFIHSPKGRTADDYRKIVAETRADFTALSGWLGFVEGLDPKTTFNIHPAVDLIKFGGRGFHGHHVHEAVIAAYKRGEVTHSGVTMHFATEKYDDPSAIFFQRTTLIEKEDTPETLQKRVNVIEHEWQAIITNSVIQGEISWDGKNPDSIQGRQAMTFKTSSAPQDINWAPILLCKKKNPTEEPRGFSCEIFGSNFLQYSSTSNRLMQCSKGTQHLPPCYNLGAGTC